jgi:chain length determinant protein tyrosine kinase EpsG
MTLAQPRERSIGAMLVDAGKLTLKDAERVLQLQKGENLRFGEAAIQLGLVSAAEVEFFLSQQFNYPVVQKGESQLAAELIAAYEPTSDKVEIFRDLRSQLMLRWFGDESERKTLAVVSPASGDGRSYVAANLAIVFSQLGERTLLIDADMRRPRLHQMFGIDNRNGLSALLAGRVDGGTIQRIPGLVDLSLLPAGATPPNPQELLAKPAFAALLREVAGDFDVVIIDTSAAAHCADAQNVSIRAGGTLMVARTNETRVKSLRVFGKALGDSGVKVVGVVLNER